MWLSNLQMKLTRVVALCQATRSFVNHTIRKSYGSVTSYIAPLLMLRNYETLYSIWFLGLLVDLCVCLFGHQRRVESTPQVSHILDNERCARCNHRSKLSDKCFHSRTFCKHATGIWNNLNIWSLVEHQSAVASHRTQGHCRTTQNAAAHLLSISTSMSARRT